jgi:hypothetical protein
MARFDMAAPLAYCEPVDKIGCTCPCRRFLAGGNTFFERCRLRDAKTTGVKPMSFFDRVHQAALLAPSIKLVRAQRVAIAVRLHSREMLLFLALF